MRDTRPQSLFHLVRLKIFESACLLCDEKYFLDGGTRFLGSVERRARIGAGQAAHVPSRRFVRERRERFLEGVGRSIDPCESPATRDGHPRKGQSLTVKKIFFDRSGCNRD